MVLSRLSSLVIAASLVLVAGRAAAQSDSDKEKAKLLHEAGLAEYQAGRYGAAVDAFRHAYKLVPAPGILFNLAQAYRLKGDCKSARRSYKKFLKVSTDAAQIALAKEHLATLTKCAGDAPPATAPPPAVPAPAPAPTAAPTPAPPAPVAPQPSPAPAPAPRVATPPPAPAALPAPAAPAAAGADLSARGPIDRHPGRAKRLAGIGLGSAGAAFLIISVYHGLKARSDAGDLDDFYEQGGSWTPDLADKEDSLDRNRTRAIGFGLVGAIALTGGGIFYWMGNQDEKQAAQIGVAPAQSGGAVMSWSGRF
jgi:tetratricopeptide (TPR) repeat protein